MSELEVYRWIHDQDLEVTATKSTGAAGTAIIASPGAGRQIVFTEIQLQNLSSTAITVSLNDGTSNLRSVLCPTLGSGLSALYDPSTWWEWPEDKAVFLVMSADEDTNYYIRYHVLSVR